MLTWEISTYTFVFCLIRERLGFSNRARIRVEHCNFQGCDSSPSTCTPPPSPFPPTRAADISVPKKHLFIAKMERHVHSRLPLLLLSSRSTNTDRCAVVLYLHRDWQTLIRTEAGALCSSTYRSHATGTSGRCALAATCPVVIPAAPHLPPR